MKRSQFNDKIINGVLNKYSVYNDNIIDLDISLSTLSQQDLLGLSKNKNLNENSLIFSCFDPKNTLHVFYDTLSEYPYRQNNLFFINNEQMIFPMNYNILNKDSHFDIDDKNQMIVKIDNKTLLKDIDENYLIPNLRNLNRASSITNGLFIYNSNNFYIDSNEYLNINNEYQYIINNFININEDTTNYINSSKRLIKKLLKIKDYKNLLAISNVIIDIDYDKNIIYEDKNNSVEIPNYTKEYNTQNKTNKYYFPQYFITNGILDFNIIVPFKFSYVSKYGIPNYIDFIDKSNIEVNISKVNEEYKTYIRNNREYSYNISDYSTDPTSNYQYNQYFHDVNCFQYSQYGDVTELNPNNLFTETPNTTILSFNQNKSYIIDYLITNDKITKSTNTYEGEFKYVLNFSVLAKSNFDLAKIIIDFKFIDKQLPIMLRLCNNTKSNKVKLNDVVYFNYEEGFNFDGHGKIMGECVIPESFFSEKNSNKIPGYNKPLFVSLKDGYGNITSKELNTYRLTWNSESELSMYSDSNYNNGIKYLKVNNNMPTSTNELEKIPWSVYYVKDVFKDSSGTKLYNVMLKSKHFIQFLYKKKSGSYINVDNIEEYDYEIDKQRGNTKYDLTNQDIHSQGANIGFYPYLNTISGNSLSLFSSLGNNVNSFYIENKKALNTYIDEDSNKTYNELFFKNIFDICGNGLSKGDYYFPSILETYVIRSFNIPYYTITRIITSSFKPNNNSISFINPTSINSPIYNSTTGKYNIAPANVFFKIPDFTVLSGDNYYMYFDKDENMYILDYFGQFVNQSIVLNVKMNNNNANISFNIKNQTSGINFSPSPIIYNAYQNELTIKILSIRKNITSFIIYYVDSDADMNICNNEYRILCKIFIKK